MEVISWLLAFGRQHIKWITTLLGWVAAIYAWMRKMRAEARFREVQRRAEAPYLIPASFSAHEIADPVHYVDMVKNGEKLGQFAESLGSHKLEMRQGFTNAGQKVRAVSILQPSPISLVKVGDVMSEGASPGWLRYVYEHGRKGQSERFSLRFESYGGLKQTHIYELIHGVRHLQRVDPA